MEITEVRVKLMEDSDDRLQAFCSITFDNAFVIRDLKIIDGANGPFVAMPSRKLTAHCPFCNCKNHLRASYCNQCGKRLREERAPRDADGRAKLYADVAHPINPQCREMIQARVIAEFEAELDRAEEPGYVSRYDEDYDLDVGPEGDELEPAPRSVTRSAQPVAKPAAPVAKTAAPHPQPPVLPPPRSEVEAVRTASPSPSERREVPRREPSRGDSPKPDTPRPSVESPAAVPTPAVSASPAEATPRGPHRPLAGDRDVPPARPKPARGEFGAGIFEQP